MSARERRAPRDPERHPEWCSQGPECDGPKVYAGGYIEAVHCTAAYLEHLDGWAQVAFQRFDSIHGDGRHEVDEVAYLSVDGTFTARQAEAYALAILAAVRQLDAGLDVPPGGLRPTPGAVA